MDSTQLSQSPYDAAPFQIRAEQIPGGRLCLWLSGDIDSAGRDLIVAELEAGGPPSEIYIEMSEVRYLGSAAISALIHACRLLERSDERVTLIDPPSGIVAVLDTCQITRQFTIQLS